MKSCPLCSTSYPGQQTHCSHDGALLIETREFDPGTVIRGKYRIERLLGRGGMGTVYLAEHLLLGRQRALKFISSELSQDPSLLQRFRREALAASELHHPNVVQVHDLDQAEDGSPFIAMEFIEGQDLCHALAHGPFPVERALSLTRGIALGLGAAHSKHILHRDVKPANILLTCEPGQPETPKLLDFGIAAVKDAATAISRTRGLMLTPEYAAPEQWRGMPAEEQDERVDLYALGGLLYQMLTGQTCFRAQNLEGWMYNHLSVEPQPPSALRPELKCWTGLDTLVIRLLAKDREQRPRYTAEVVSLLDSVKKVEIQPTVLERTAPEARPATLLDVVSAIQSTDAKMEAPTSPAKDTPTNNMRALYLSVGIAVLLVAVFAAGRVYYGPQSQQAQTQQTQTMVDQTKPIEQTTDQIPVPRHTDTNPTPQPVTPSPVNPTPANPQPTQPITPMPSYPNPAYPPHTNPEPVNPQPINPAPVNPHSNPTPVTPQPVANSNLVWTDPATGLMWQKRDSGNILNWNQAAKYCKNLRLGGYSDWRLPEIDELQTIYDQDRSETDWRDSTNGPYHVKGQLQLSGWQWSSSPLIGSQVPWFFIFDHPPNATRHFDKYDKRLRMNALCVRRSGE